MQLRSLHRFLGIFICLPSLLWGLSGSFLAWKNFAEGPDEVHGPQAVKRPFRIDEGRAILAGAKDGAKPQRLDWRHLAGTPYYLVTYAEPASSVLINGETGEKEARISPELATRIAAEEAPAGVTVKGVTLQEKPTFVYIAQMELPVYRVALSDATNVYVSPTTGEAFFRAGKLFWAIRFAFFGLHVFKWSSGPGPHYSYLLLMGLGLLLAASSVTGMWLWLRIVSKTKR